MCPGRSEDNFADDELLGWAHDNSSCLASTTRGILYGTSDDGCVLCYGSEQYGGEWIRFLLRKMAMWCYEGKLFQLHKLLRLAPHYSETTTATKSLSQGRWLVSNNLEPLFLGIGARRPWHVESSLWLPQGSVVDPGTPTPYCGSSYTYRLQLQE